MLGDLFGLEFVGEREEVRELWMLPQNPTQKSLNFTLMITVCPQVLQNRMCHLGVGSGDEGTTLSCDKNVFLSWTGPLEDKDQCLLFYRKARRQT